MPVGQKVLDCLLSGLDASAYPAALLQATGLNRTRLEAVMHELFGCGVAELGRHPELLSGRMPAKLFRDKPGRQSTAKIFTDHDARQLRAISYGTAPGWYGQCLLATTGKGICWLDLHPGVDAVQALREAFPGSLLRHDNSRAAELAARVFGRPGKPVAVHLVGTRFQLRVWQALLSIPAGACMSYGQLARSIGSPRAARAVGRAAGSNRIAVLVPCHRVLPANGIPGGFRWGSAVKWGLLLREQMPGSDATRQVA